MFIRLYEAAKNIGDNERCLAPLKYWKFLKEMTWMAILSGTNSRDYTIGLAWL